MFRKSENLIPLVRKKPSGIKDTGLARQVQKGYVLVNKNEDSLILLPLGERIYTRLTTALLKRLSVFHPQIVNTTGSSRGLLDIAVRIIKRKCDLPLVLAERRGTDLFLAGFAEDEDSCSIMVSDAIRATGAAMCETGIKLRRADRLLKDGYAVDLLCASSSRPLHTQNGLLCPSCGLLMTEDTPARISYPVYGEDLKPLTDIETPGCKTIEDLCNFLGITPLQTVKTMFYTVNKKNPVAVIVRGDREICLPKLRAALQGAEVYPSTPEELKRIMGDSAGYMGPVGLPSGVTLMADFSVENIKNAVIGANRPGYHRTGACWGRDFKTENLHDLSLHRENAPCPFCGTSMKNAPLYRIARFHPVDRECLAEESLTFFNGKGKSHVRAWSVHIDLSALLSAMLEFTPHLSDEIAPFDVCVCPQNPGNSGLPILLALLEDSGREVFLDDRESDFATRKAEALATGAPLIILEGEEPDTLEIIRAGKHGTVTVDEFLKTLK